MKIRYLKGSSKGLIQDLPDDVAGPLIQEGMAERVEEVEETPEEPLIDAELGKWLENHGFRIGPEGVAYQKIEKYAEGYVKLQVAFDDDERGMRYGYRLNFEKDPPEWKSDPVLREHPILKQYKEFRDVLFKERRVLGMAPVSPGGTDETKEIPAGEGQVLLQMEAKDDSQILAEMHGDFKAEVLKQLFYSFTSAGRKIVGLSYKGVKQMAMRQGHIEVKELEIKETEKAWLVVCKARDKARDLEVYGVSIQPKEMELRDGGKLSDPFSLTKAVSKAQRNALRMLIPETIITEAYRRWQGGYER